VVFLFTPLYISNYCVNRCPYCSFAGFRRIRRRQLSLDEIRDEAEYISREGMRHILLLTGEARGTSSVDYVAEAVRIAAGSFSSVGIEVYPMSEAEYGRMIEAGADQLTIYQEVYDRNRYAALHAGGPKEDYRFRLEAPERACRPGMRSVSLGALLGLHEYRSEMMALALHVRYLQDRFPDVEVGVSFPRIRPLAGDFSVPAPVDERCLARIVSAFRLVFPSVGITMSTRESRRMRDGMVRLGVTRMSAGVSTAVGGHGEAGSTTQFEISDTRGVDQMRRDLLAAGYQPVMHDWHGRLVRGAKSGRPRSA
jgi:2-iminoacetate synthase